MNHILIINNAVYTQQRNFFNCFLLSEMRFLLSTANLPVHYYFQGWLKVTLGFSYNQHKAKFSLHMVQQIHLEINLASTCSGLEDSNNP